jgi:hypothetical protein
MKKSGIVFLLLIFLAATTYSIDLDPVDILEFLTEYATFVEAGNTGLTSFPVLKIPMGGEYEAMGTAYTAVGRDLSFVDSNPASTSVLKFTELSVTHNNLIADVSMEGLIYTMRFEDLGVGFTGKFVHVPFTEYDGLGVQQSSTLYSEAVGGLNLSYNFLDSFYFHGIAVGLNTKLAARRIAEEVAPDQSAVGVMTDIGVLTRVNFLKHFASRERNLSFGILAQNLGPPALGEPLPTALRAGFAYAPVRPVTVSGDLIYPVSLVSGVSPEPLGFAVGTSVQITDFLGTQAGFLMQGGNPRFTLGSTVDLTEVTLAVNYTLDMTTQTGKLERFSLQARFNLGDRGRGQRRDTVEEYYLDSLVAYAAGEIEKTVELSRKAIEMDPGFQPARETLASALRSLELQRQMDSIRMGEQIPELEIDEVPGTGLSPADSPADSLGLPSVEGDIDEAVEEELQPAESTGEGSEETDSEGNAGTDGSQP